MREWVLLNPGPANTTASVRQALVMPDLCHREPECFEMMRGVRERLVRLAGAGEAFSAVLLTGSGTAGVEAVLASAVPREGALLVVDNGVYGDRMARIARAHRIPVHVIARDMTIPIDPAEVEAALVRYPDLSHVAMVHHETTTGLLNPLAAVAEVVARHGRRLVVDATSSLFGEPLDVAQEGIDFVTASAAKCVQAVPGVAFVLARRAALEALRDREPRSVYLDLYTHWSAQEQDNTPFTPAVQVLHALEQALVELEAQALADVEEFCGKIKAGKDSHTDPHFVLVARVEALIAGWGLPEALTRAEAYHGAGADAVLIHSRQSSPAEIFAFLAEWGGRCPVVLVPTKYWRTPTGDFRARQVSVVIWANHLLRSAITAMQATAQRLRADESLVNVEPEVAPLHEVFRLQGDDELMAAEQRYLPTARGPALSAIVLAAGAGEGFAGLTAAVPKAMLKRRVPASPWRWTRCSRARRSLIASSATAPTPAASRSRG